MNALIWLGLNLLSVVFLSFFSMMEMACVSFNKVRLHYYVSKGDKRAIWLNYLLQHPFRLFGTTLIGVNVAMVIGSECAREFHSAIGLNPDLAPLTQVILVVIIGELAPMFAARHYAEHVALLGVPLVFASAKLLAPLIYVIGLISKLFNYLALGQKAQEHLFLSQDELQTILEEHTEGTDIPEINLITQNIFRLRHKTAGEISEPLSKCPKLSSNATVGQMKDLIKKTNADFVLIYYKEITNIIGIAFPRDLMRSNDTKRVRDDSRPPWFVTKQAKLTDVLHQFQKNNEQVAVILDREGKAQGMITLDDLLSEIFGEGEITPHKEKQKFIVERSFPGDTTVEEIFDEFEVKLDNNPTLTLSDLIKNTLGRVPEVGESITIDPFEIIVKETTLRDVKSVILKSKG